MTAAAPLVSVVVPCFNLGQHLHEAVDSVLSQTVDSYEILVGDDGSTDEDTRRVLDTFSKPHTRLFRYPHRGLAATRNALISEARGTYLCALDADDVLHETFLERTLAAFEDDRALTFVSTHLQMFGIDDRLWPEIDRCDLAALLVDDTVITAALVKRDAVIRVGGYDTNMPAQGDEDWDLWISLVKAGHRGRILPEVLFFYRRRHGSMIEDCTSGPTHLSLVNYIVRKHEAAYRTLLPEVLNEKERAVGELRRANVTLEREVGELRALVSRRRSELEGLRQRLQGLQQGTASAGQISNRSDDDLLREFTALNDEYRRAQQEIRDLRGSASWTLTRPLRAGYDLLRRLRS